ncbi:MAG: hypothetical protein GY910_11175 [bacterium]|nr:hypothetical protein [bacterium]
MSAPAKAIAWPKGDLVDVAVPAADHAIVLSADGRIHTTRDGGASWRAAHVPAVGPLRGVSMAGTRIGWAIGGGVILKTDDGGRRWRRQRLPGRAADLDLARVAVIDSERALAVGGAGTRLRTVDGGAAWQDHSLESEPTGEVVPAFVDVACAPDRSGRCWSVDREIRFSADAGASWQILEIADGMNVDPVDFGFDRVEVPESVALRIREAAERRPRAADLRWRIDVGLSALEIDRIGGARDPSALFALIEARIAEVRLTLEALGVGADQIEALAAPPWAYEDVLDDDPELLSRFWSARLEVGARARIHTREQISIAALVVDSLGFGIGVGRSRRGLRTVRADTLWSPVALAVSHDLLDVDAAADRVIAVGLQGGLWISNDRGDSWQRHEAEGAGVSSEALRSVSFDPEGRHGFVVGAHGTLLRSRDGGASWRALTPPTQADSARFR